MPSNIYPIAVDNDEMQELFNILHKYQDTILSMAKVVGNSAAEDYNRAVEIINGVLARAEAAISPMPCLSKACMNSSYCYRPTGQCEFVKYMKAGYNVARVNETMLDTYLALGWTIAEEDTSIKPSAQRYLLIYKKPVDTTINT
jgi:hypothetical protein